MWRRVLRWAELVAGISTSTVSLVLGGGHSIGIPLAVSADYTFVAKSATMTPASDPHQRDLDYG